VTSPPAKPAATTRLLRPGRVVAVTLALLLSSYLVLATWVVLGIRTHPDWVNAAPQGAAGRAMNVLLVGTDTPPAGQVARADTLVIVHLPADGSAIYLVSLPRVAQALLPQGVIQLRTSRVIGGVPLTARAVEQVAGIQLDHVVETDFEGFAGLADVVGGVTVTNPHASTGDGGRGVPEGPLTLHGREALAFVRDHSVTDQVRTERQRSVLKAVLAKLPLAIANPVNLARISTDLVSHVDTDDTVVQDFPEILRRVLAGRNRIVGIEPPLLPRTNDWDRPRLDPAGMAVLAQALRDGTMADYRPDRP